MPENQTPEVAPQQIATDPVRQAPRGEFVTLAGLAALGSTVLTAAKEGHALFNSVEPLLIQVLDSVLIENHHLLGLRITNNTTDGVYIEAVNALDPEEISYEAFYKPRPLDSPHERLACLPHLLAPLANIELSLRFPVLDQTKFEDRPWVCAGLVFTRLSEKQQTEAVVNMHLRWSKR